jgi:hypothetical protein
VEKMAKRTEMRASRETPGKPISPEADAKTKNNFNTNFSIKLNTLSGC